jgi:hypothetical protein
MYDDLKRKDRQVLITMFLKRKREEPAASTFRKCDPPNPTFYILLNSIGSVLYILLYSTVFKAGRTKLRWLDCIENDPKSMGVKKFRKKARNRKKQKDSVGYHSEGGTA